MTPETPAPARLVHLPPEHGAPEVPESLVRWLERLVPEPEPFGNGGALTPEALWYQCGQRNIVRTLRGLHTRQQKD
jgi:hypothetical protein